MRCWLRTAELEPSHPQINYRIAQAYWADGDTARSREHFLTEIRANPGDVDVIFDFALFLLEDGEIESAKEKFNRILELKSDFAPALFYLGEIAFSNSDYEQAAELYSQAIQKDKKLAGPCYRLAQLALMKEQKQKVKIYLLSELGLGPEDADALVSMASMSLAIGDLELSTHCLLRAVDIDRANADAHYYLGVVTANRGWLEEAVEFLTQAL